MGLQYYDLSLAITESKEFAAAGKFIYYLSGTTPNVTAGTVSASAGNQAIKVRPGTSGNEIVLMPGQRYRMDEDENTPSFWRISNFNAVEAITGRLMIGEGDFNDANVNATVNLATSAVLNSAALPVQKQALSTITTFAPVSVGIAATALVSDATQRCLRIRNTSATAYVYLGGATVTIANAGIVIPPMGMWIEEEAAGAAWYAISDTAATSVAIQGLKL